MAIPGLGRAIDTIRRIDRLFENIRKLQESNEALADRVLDIERRLAALENREEVLIERMGHRASEAASGVVTNHLVDLARRLGRLEERTRRSDEPKRIEE